VHVGDDGSARRLAIRRTESPQDATCLTVDRANHAARSASEVRRFRTEKP
jgi:hypothetical protein